MPLQHMQAIAHHRECQLVSNDQNANRCPGYTMKVEVKTK